MESEKMENKNRITLLALLSAFLITACSTVENDVEKSPAMAKKIQKPLQIMSNTPESIAKILNQKRLKNRFLAYKEVFTARGFQKTNWGNINY